MHFVHAPLEDSSHFRWGWGGLDPHSRYNETNLLSYLPAGESHIFFSPSSITEIVILDIADVEIGRLFACEYETSAPLSIQWHVWLIAVQIVVLPKHAAANIAKSAACSTLLDIQSRKFMLFVVRRCKSVRKSAACGSFFFFWPAVLFSNKDQTAISSPEKCRSALPGKYWKPSIKACKTA